MTTRAAPIKAAAGKSAANRDKVRAGGPLGYREAWGLVSVGAASASYLSQMSSFLDRLGPVIASSFQVASRLSNSLRHGYPVSHYLNLELCPLVFIFEPESSLDRILRDLAAQMPVHRTMIVLCECNRDSFAPNPLRAGGARIATLNAVEQSRNKLFVAEGDPDTIKALDRLLTREKRKLVVMPPGVKPLFLAGVQLAKYLPLPAIAASVESLRAAGFPRSEAARLTGTLVAHATASYEKAGKKAWHPAAAGELRLSAERNAEILRDTDPRLANVYVAGVRAALSYFTGAASTPLARTARHAH